MQNILRWILTLPGAVAASFFAYGIVVNLERVFVDFLFGGSWIAKLLPYISFAGSYCLQGAAFVYVGSLIAPSRKTTVAIVFSCIGYFIIGAMLMSYFFLKVLNSPDTSSTTLFSAVFSAIGISIILYMAITRQLEFHLNRDF